MQVKSDWLMEKLEQARAVIFSICVSCRCQLRTECRYRNTDVISLGSNRESGQSAIIDFASCTIL